MLRDVSRNEASHVATGNNILNALSSPLRELVLSAGRPCRLSQKTVLVRQGAKPNNIVFLNSGLASQVMMMSDGKTSEVGMLGCESLIGALTILGRSLHHAECIMQISGTGT